MVAIYSHLYLIVRKHKPNICQIHVHTLAAMIVFTERLCSSMPYGTYVWIYLLSIKNQGKLKTINKERLRMMIASKRDILIILLCQNYKKSVMWGNHLTGTLVTTHMHEKRMNPKESSVDKIGTRELLPTGG